MTVKPARPQPHAVWDDTEAELEYGKALPAHRTLSRAEAQDLSKQLRSVSPWKVLRMQALLGLAIALVAFGLTRRPEVAASALYGALVVVVPGALIARGMTSPLTSMSPGTSAVSFMLWELVKIAVSVGLLMLAPKIVSHLSWPALLVAMVVCIKIYWLALKWRQPSVNSN